MNHHLENIGNQSVNDLENIENKITTYTYLFHKTINN